MAGDRAIELHHLIVAEGRDDQILIEALAKREGLTHVQVTHCQGRDNLGNKLAAYAASPGFVDLISLGIVLDAEKSAAATGAMVEAAIVKAKAMLVPATTWPRTTVHVVPDPEPQGMMEDVCLATLADRPVMGCVDTYLSCCHDHGGQAAPPNPSKARFQAWLATQPLGSGKPYFLGSAVECDLLDLSHAAFGALRAFIREVAR